MKRYLLVFLCLILFFGCLKTKRARDVYPAIGLATWYNPRLTASGERYQQGQSNCAMRRRGFGKNYLVCNMANHRCVEVRHNDYGPSLFLFMMGRIIDLSENAFSEIADVRKGVIRVRVGEIHPGETD
jgi:rare lipoprotein A